MTIRKKYTGGHLGNWDGDLDAMERAARIVLERDGCDPATVKHSYVSTYRYDFDGHGPYHAWEGVFSR